MSIGKRVQGRLLLARDVPDAHALLNVGRRHAVAERDDKLGDLLNVDQVARLVLGRDDLGAAGHLLFVCTHRSTEQRRANGKGHNDQKRVFQSGDGV